MAEDHNAPGLGELSRQVRDVLVRFSELAVKLETQFVRADIFELYKQQIVRELQRIDRDISDTKADDERERKHLANRVASLEDNQKWLVRIVVTFVILGVLGVAFGLKNAGGA